jgi:hypothetical protein
MSASGRLLAPPVYFLQKQMNSFNYSFFISNNSAIEILFHYTDTEYISPHSQKSSQKSPIENPLDLFFFDSCRVKQVGFKKYNSLNIKI